MPDHPTPNQAALLHALAAPGARLYCPRAGYYEVALTGVPKSIHSTTKQCFRACLKRDWVAEDSKGSETFKLSSEGRLARGRM